MKTVKKNFCNEFLGFRRHVVGVVGVVDISILLRYGAEEPNYYLPTFRDKAVVSYPLFDV
jgi:hypothetical protein